MLTESPLYRNRLADGTRIALERALHEIRHKGVLPIRTFEEAFRYLGYWSTEFIFDPSITEKQALPVYAALDNAYDATLLPEEFPECKALLATREEFLAAKVDFVEWIRQRFSNLCDPDFEPEEQERYFRKVLRSFLTTCLVELD